MREGVDGKVRPGMLILGIREIVGEKKGGGTKEITPKTDLISPLWNKKKEPFFKDFILF